MWCFSSTTLLDFADRWSADPDISWYIRSACRPWPVEDYTTFSHTTCHHTTYSHITCLHATYSHTTCSHTTCHHTLRGRRGTWWHRPSLRVAGVALGDIDLNFASQAWHLVTWTCTLRGRRGTYGTGLALVARLVPVGAAALCVAGVALGDMDRGRRGTWWHRPSLCVAGVALGDMDLHFASQAWHLVTSTFTLRRRRGTWWHGRALCVAGVALMALGWLWWRAWFPWAPRLFAWQAWHLATWTVALGDIDLHFASQAWHLVIWSFTSRRRRGTWWHGRALCVAGVALMALGWLWWRAWFPCFGAK